jgi:hypothetical protein
MVRTQTRYTRAVNRFLDGVLSCYNCHSTGVALKHALDANDAARNVLDGVLAKLPGLAGNVGDCGAAIVSYQNPSIRLRQDVTTWARAAASDSRANYVKAVHQLTHDFSAIHRQQVRVAQGCGPLLA